MRQEKRNPNGWRGVFQSSRQGSYFLEVAETLKPFLEKIHKPDPNYPPEVLRREREQLDVELLKIEDRYQDVTGGSLCNPHLTMGQEGFYKWEEKEGANHLTPLPSKMSMFEELHFRRHGEFLAQTLDALKRNPGDRYALKNLQQTEREFQAFFYSAQPTKKTSPLPPGGLQRRFHEELVGDAIGLDLHTQKISDEQWAACFDAICPCGKTHDAKNLRKVRKRVLERLEQPAAAIQPQEPRQS